MTRVRHVADINPSTPEFDRLHDDASLCFVPLEAVWSSGVDTSRRRPKREVASGYTRFREGDVLIPKITPTFQADRTVIAHNLDGGVAAGTTELHVVRVTNAEPRYIRYLFSSRPFLEGGEAEMTGVAGQQRVPDGWIRDVVVPIDDVRRQRKIADFLDAETARLDALINKKRRMAALLVEREAVLISDMIAASAVGRVPLRRIVSEPPQYGASESGEAGEETWPRYIRITDLRADGTLRDDDVKRLSPSIAHLYALKDGDLLVARSGATVGKAFRYSVEMGPACFAGYLIRFRIDPERARSELVELWTQTHDYWTQIYESAVQATIQNVSAERYLDLQVPDVPKSVQLELVEELTAARSMQEGLRVRLEHQIVLLEEHRQALITAAVTGELSLPGVAA